MAWRNVGVGRFAASFLGRGGDGETQGGIRLAARPCGVGLDFVNAGGFGVDFAAEAGHAAAVRILPDRGLATNRRHFAVRTFDGGFQRLERSRALADPLGLDDHLVALPIERAVGGEFDAAAALQPFLIGREPIEHLAPERVVGGQPAGPSRRGDAPAPQRVAEHHRHPAAALLFDHDQAAAIGRRRWFPSAPARCRPRRWRGSHLAARGNP